VRRIVVGCGLAVLVVAAAAGAGVAWYRVADHYAVAAQLSPAVAGGIGGLTTIGFLATVVAAFASRRAAAKRRLARNETVALATAAVEGLLRRAQSATADFGTSAQGGQR